MLLRSLTIALLLLIGTVTCTQPVAQTLLTFELVGVEKSELENNIDAHLANVSYSGRAPDEAVQARIVSAVNTALQPFGYYNAEVTLDTEQDEVVIHVQLGEPLRISHITREIIGEGRVDTAFRSKFNALDMKPGDVLHQPTYQQFKSAMFNYALANGYFDFYWQATRLDLVREQNQANIVLIAQSGQQYSFGEIQLVGDDRAKAIIERLTPFKAGDPYSAAKLTTFNRRLNETGYFRRAIARPLVNQAKSAKVPIEITLAHLPRDIFNVGGGASSDTGPRVRGRWERPWVNTRGHSITGEVYASALEQAASLDYRIPLQDVNNDYASFQTRYEFEDNAVSDTKSEKLSLSGHRFWKEAESPWQRSASLTFEREMFTQGASVPQTISLLMPGYSVGYSLSDNALSISDGKFFVVAIQGAYEGVGSDISLLKITAKTKYIATFNNTHRVFLRAEAGAIETENFDRVPSSLRFFTGGDQSIRGFQYREISPFELNSDGDRVPTGGQYLATGSAEYAYPVSTNWRAAVFADIGTATNDFSDRLATGYGIGAHWLTLIGPVRFYIARGHNEFENTWRFHFTLGPEL